jgi:hypothetical protein
MPIKVLRACLADDAVTGVVLSKPLVFGQIRHALGQPAAQMTFLSSPGDLQVPAITGLVEWLARVAGQRGALRVVAEVDEQSLAFEALRRAGFVVYARQRVFCFLAHASHNEDKKSAQAPAFWRPIQATDEEAVRSLCQLLVPPLAQPAETFLQRRPMRGLVYWRANELQGYVDVLRGRNTDYLIPVIHPDAQPIQELLLELVSCRNRSVCVNVRSYQDRISDVLTTSTSLVANASQALMVKYLARFQRSEVSASQAILEHAWTRNLEAHSSTKDGMIG